MEKIETIVPTLMFVAINGDTLVTFKPNGVIEFGEKYQNNPNAVAQEFVRLVAKFWPEVVEASIPKTMTVEEAWQELCETPDITSPEEYPDHALITMEQLKYFMDRASRRG